MCGMADQSTHERDGLRVWPSPTMSERLQPIPSPWMATDFTAHDRFSVMLPDGNNFAVFVLERSVTCVRIFRVRWRSRRRLTRPEDLFGVPKPGGDPFGVDLRSTAGHETDFTAVGGQTTAVRRGKMGRE